MVPDKLNEGLNEAVTKLQNNYPNITNTQQVIPTTDRQLQMYTPKTYLIPRSDNKVLIISPLQQIVNADANSRQQKVISTAGSLQQTVFTNAGSQQESCFLMSDNRKVVSVPEAHFPKLTIMPMNYQQNVDSVSDYVKNFISYNPQTELQIPVLQNLIMSRKLMSYRRLLSFMKENLTNI